MENFKKQLDGIELLYGTSIFKALYFNLVNNLMTVESINHDAINKLIANDLEDIIQNVS